MQQKSKALSMTCKYFRNFHNQGARVMHEDLVIIAFIGFRLDRGRNDEC